MVNHLLCFNLVIESLIFSSFAGRLNCVFLAPCFNLVIESLIFSSCDGWLRWTDAHQFQSRNRE